MKLTESNLEFDFIEGITAIEFDKTAFFGRKFQVLPQAKGVDFIANSQEVIFFIEVKNCKGHEADNRYRIAPNNAKISTAPTKVDTSEKESLDIEMAKKVAMSIACLVGAQTQPQFQQSDEIKPYCKEVIRDDISANKKTIKILLFLEGDFATKTNSKKMIMKMLADSIKKKLSWINSQVFVEDTETQSKRYFTVSNETS